MAENWPDWLIGYMGRNDLNNRGLAVLLGASPSTVGNWRKGDKPETDMILKLAEVSGEASAAQLFEMIHGGGPEPEMRDRYMREIARMLEPMPDAQRRAAVEIIRSYVDSLKRGLNGQGPG